MHAIMLKYSGRQHIICLLPFCTNKTYITASEVGTIFNAKSKKHRGISNNVLLKLVLFI